MDLSLQIALTSLVMAFLFYIMIYEVEEKRRPKAFLLAVSGFAISGGTFLLALMWSIWTY